MLRRDRTGHEGAFRVYHKSHIHIIQRYVNGVYAMLSFMQYTCLHLVLLAAIWVSSKPVLNAIVDTSNHVLCLLHFLMF